MSQLRSALSQSWTVNRPLTFVGVTSAVMLLACLFGLVLDHRMITGMPAWDKPAKFAVSVGLYSFTLIWMLGHVTGTRARFARAAASLSAAGFIVELVIIAVQAARGTSSHFNISTPLDTALYAAMGGFVALIWGMNFLAAVLLTLQPLPGRAFALSLRLALFLTLIGGSVGALMTVPSSAQLQQSHPTLAGAHTVGGVDGGPGLPFLGWSTVHGDLRVSHFVGLHALQVLPLLFWLVSCCRSWGETQRVGLIWIGAASYLGVMGLLFWQAERGQSVIAPDALTLVLAGLLATVTAFGTLLVLRTRRTVTSLTS